MANSTLYEAWVSSLRVSWMGVRARRIFGGFAAVLGDRSIDWLKQSQLERFPATASAPAIALIASERQMDTYPGEDPADIAAREPFATRLMQFAGSPLGILMGLHLAGFDGAVIVQQNGDAYELTLPLPAFTGDPQEWDPTGNIVVTELSELAVPMQSDRERSRHIPVGRPWWTFDSNTDKCSRFAVLFPGPTLPSWFLTWAKVEFDGTQDGSEDNPWPLATWNNEFPDTTYQISPSPPTMTGPSVAVWADGATKTTRGVRIAASAPFVGTVDVLAWRLGQNPYADLHPGDLARLQNTIRRWAARKAECRGVFALVYGEFIGWPVRLIGDSAPQPTSIVSYREGF